MEEVGIGGEKKGEKKQEIGSSFGFIGFFFTCSERDADNAVGRS